MKRIIVGLLLAFGLAACGSTQHASVSHLGLGEGMAARYQGHVGAHLPKGIRLIPHGVLPAPVHDVPVRGRPTLHSCYSGTCYEKAYGFAPNPGSDYGAKVNFCSSFWSETAANPAHVNNTLWVFFNNSSAYVEMGEWFIKGWTDPTLYVEWTFPDGSWDYYYFSSSDLTNVNFPANIIRDSSTHYWDFNYNGAALYDQDMGAAYTAGQWQAGSETDNTSSEEQGWDLTLSYREGGAWQTPWPSDSGVEADTGGNVSWYGTDSNVVHEVGGLSLTGCG